MKTIVRYLAFWCALLAVGGCSLFRANPLEEERGAVVLVFDTRTAGDLRALRQTLAKADARATVFVAGQITRGSALPLYDLHSDGHEIGLSGLKGTDPQLYCQMFGEQKYFQDEIVVQVLSARKFGLKPRYFLLDTITDPRVLSLPKFLKAKGFASVVHKMPDDMPPRGKPLDDLSVSLLHAYAMTTNNFDRAQIAALAEHNQVLIVRPNRQVLPQLLTAAQEEGVPFATIADLKKGKK